MKIFYSLKKQMRQVVVSLIMLSFCSSIALAQTYPDNVINADCYTEPPKQAWSIKNRYIAPTPLYDMDVPLVGDIDSDGNVEIICASELVPSPTGTWVSNTVHVFNAKTGTVKTTLSGLPYFYPGSGTRAIADVDNDGNAELLLASGGSVDIDGGYIHCYNLQTGVRKWKSNAQFTTDPTCRAGGNVLVADINADGVPEVIMYDKVFNARTGALLLDMALESNSLSFGYGSGHGVNGAPCPGTMSYFPVMGDMDNDGKLEFVAGNNIYKINLTNGSGTAGNSRSILRTATSRVDVGDGFTAVADLDLDGYMDVIVTRNVAGTAYIYAWNGKTGALLNNNVISFANIFGGGPSIPFVGDLEGDGRPDISFTSTNKTWAYKYNPGTNNLDKFWELNTQDGSGATTLTMFDFNQDGKMELLYRDESKLRIINGSLKSTATGNDTTVYNLAEINCATWTMNEYPVVADVTGSGNANIIVLGKEIFAANTTGYLFVFENSVPGTWAPARKVWNQWSYNAVNVNNDLTIPAFNFNPATRFPGKNGILGDADDTRPFNGYLMQQTMLSDDGVPFFLTPNAQQSNEKFTYYGSTDIMKVSVRVDNTGDAPLQSPLKITLYKDLVNAASTKYTYSYLNNIPAGGFAVIEFLIPNFKQWVGAITPTTTLILKVNDNGDTKNHQLSCGEPTPAPILFSEYTPELKSKAYIACPGASVNLEIQPDAGYTYAWYDAAFGGNLLATGTTHTLTKDNSAVQSVWVESSPTASGIIHQITKVDVTLSENCGNTTPSGCAASGTILFREDFGGNNINDPVISPVGIGSKSEYIYTTNPNSAIFGNNKYIIPKTVTPEMGLNPCWYTIDDHTYSDDPTKGYCFLVNGDTKKKVYELEMKDLCPNTQLSFSLWIANIIKTATCPNLVKPDLEFQISDMNNNVLALFRTGETINEESSIIWKLYGFEFSTPNGVSDLIFKIYSYGNGGNGNDYIIDDITVRFCAPPVALSGQFRYCAGENMNITANYTDDGTFGGAQETRWLYSTTGDLSSFSSWSEVAVGATINKTLVTGYYRAVVGLQDNLNNKRYNCCALSDAVWVTFVPELMYWDISSKNNNWNDPINWVSSIGQPLNTVPLACTDVHIPGNSNFYPSLDPAITLRNTYFGEPECRDITYHFGAEVAKPNYLSYRKAYVRYNFGYYNGSTYKTDGDIHSAVPMLRGRWYMLAAPLKRIVTGDFAVGGFPNMWQRGFKTSPDATPGHTGVLSGEWYVPENNNALEIGAKQNYGVAIWAGEYLPAEIGESDHTNLNTLKGVFEMPYFENSTVSTLHRTHSYNTGTKTSSFSYYYSTWPGLPIEPNVAPGTIVRGNESYRFVFEDASNKPQNELKVTVASGDEVMVGNVFLSSLDFHTFYTRNSAAIENYYRLYTNGAWSTYSIGSGSIILSRNIASFQSFVVKTKGFLGGTVDLYFPMSASVTRTNNDAHQLRSSGDASIPHNLLYIKAESEKGESWARVGVNINPDEKSVRQMFIHDPDRKVQVPQVYTLSKDNKMNTIQYEFGNTIEVPFGFKSDTASVVSLSVVNQENLNAESLILVDTRRNKEIDLLAATTPYRFTTEPGQGERFKLIIGRAYAPTGIETNEATDGLKVYTHGHTLYVSASKEIAEVTVSTAQGLTVHSAQSVGQTDYSKDLPASTGMYIVTVKLSTGETKTTKVIVK